VIMVEMKDGWKRFFNDPDDALDFLKNHAEKTEEADSDEYERQHVEKGLKWAVEERGQ